MAAVLLVPGLSYGKGITVTVTIPPIATLVESIAGADARVFILLKAGSDPHSYEPSPSDMKKIAGSDLVVSVGFGFERWLTKILESNEGNRGGALDCSVVVKDTIALGVSGDVNPHYWLDPVIMIDVSRHISSVLTEQYPNRKEEIEKNRDSLISKLQSLDGEIRARLARLEHRKFIAFHSAWDYFARRYNLVQADVIETAHEKEPSAKHFASLIRKIRKEKIRAVFTEAQSSSRLAKTLAEETGAREGILDTIGGVRGRADYFSLMRFNADQLGKTFGE